MWVDKEFAGKILFVVAFIVLGAIVFFQNFAPPNDDISVSSYNSVTISELKETNKQLGEIAKQTKRLADYTQPVIPRPFREDGK